MSAMSPRVIVAGALANKPRNGGEAWVRLSWIEALRSLGFNVVFVERLAAGCSDVEGATAWFREVTSRQGLDRDAWLLSPDDRDGRAPLVGDGSRLRKLVRRSDALIDISGNLSDWPLAERVPCRAYVDLDPGYTQVWAEVGAIDLEWHHLHATVGGAIGTDSCAFPDGGVTWLAVRPPTIVPPDPEPAPSPSATFSTVTSWRGAYGPLEWRGRRYGIKAHRFRSMASIAPAAPAQLTLAVHIDDADDADRQLLTGNGWVLADPETVAGSPERFDEFVRSSIGEWSIAHPVYVEGRTGWFSDRTARYLAHGRPAVVEDTGWSRFLPSGDGLLAFSDGPGALAALEAVRVAPARHGIAARDLARELFAPRRAIGGLIDAMGWAV